MGYLEGASAADPVPVIMYDGAIGRGNIGPEVTFVAPTERFKDGPRLKVSYGRVFVLFVVSFDVLLLG